MASEEGRFSALHNKVKSLHTRKHKLDDPPPKPAKKIKKNDTQTSRPSGTKNTTIKNPENQIKNTIQNNKPIGKINKTTSRTISHSKHTERQTPNKKQQRQTDQPKKAPEFNKGRPKFFDLIEKEGLVGNNKVVEQDNDDRVLKQLGKKLKLKGNKLSSDFAADGLDYILKGTGDESDSDAEGGLDLMQHMNGESESDEFSGSDEDDDGGLSGGFGIGDDGGADESQDEGQFEQELDFEDQSSGESEGDPDMDEGKAEQAKNKGNIKGEPEFKEDIYGRLRNTKTGEIVEQSKPTLYVPPMRNQSSASVQLTRQVKGLFNKLSPTNIQSIVNDLEILLRGNSKNEMTSIITNCIMASSLGDARSVASLTVATVSVLSCLIDLFGSEIGGYFLESLAKRFDESYKSGKAKDASNATLLLVHMYNFGLVHCVLIYDLIKIFVSNFTELDVELLLIIVQNAGPALRKDDPASLKEIVLLVLEREKKFEAEKNKKPVDPLFSTSRMRYMIEAIVDLKNNKAKPPPTAELIPQLKRSQKTIVGKRGGKAEELKISWDELINVHKKGRWWVVGSAWAGTAYDSKEQNTSTGNTPLSAWVADPKLGITVDLLALAAKQKMNTDTRRAVFCILMSSEDYVDAVTKLVRMGVKSKTKDIVYPEKLYNRFYGQVATSLCLQASELKYSLQIGFYQKLKNLSDNELAEKAVVNLAQLLAQVVGEGSLSLLTLKATPLHSTTPLQTKFLSIFFVALFTQFTEKQIFDVFKNFIAATGEDADRYYFVLNHTLLQLIAEDIPSALSAYKQATKERPPPLPVEQGGLMKKLKLAKKVLNMPVE